MILLASINAKYIHPSLALRLLKANLGRLEPCCQIREFYLRQPLAEMLAVVNNLRPDILGLSVSIWNHEATLKLLAGINAGQQTGRNRPIVVLGGPEVSFLRPDAPIFAYADYVIRGEGEAAFRELCEKLSDEELQCITGPERSGQEAPVFIDAAAPNLATIRTAYHLYTDEDIAHKLTYVESSRGCPFKCAFCLSSVEGPLREFPLDAFLADMEVLVKRGVRTFKFLDRSFNVNIQRACAIMDFFLEKLHSAPQPKPAPPFTVHFEMIPGNFPPALRQRLRAFPPGSLRIEIGIQTLNPGTARLIQRAGEVETELEIISFLRQETNAIVHADLIAGLPGEGSDSFAAGFDRLWIAATEKKQNAPPLEVQLGILKLLPGAGIANLSERCGMVYSPRPPYEVLETAAMSRARMDAIKNFARFWELIVNRNHFSGLLPRICPAGQPVFERFMDLANKLLARFGRNWGIDRTALREALLLFLSQGLQNCHGTVER